MEATNTAQSQKVSAHRASMLALALGALGVVYGDIGTSPLYAIKECFHGLHAIPVSEENILGVVSLVFWSLTVVVTIKYVGFILRADNDGEGGIFALLALITSKPNTISLRTRSTVVVAAIFGSALLYGDGIITPAITVLSAMEGLSVATEALQPAVVPLTCGVLFLLFLIQRRGTADIGNLFGPIMLLWFATIAGLGIGAIMRYPRILSALNPFYCVEFFASHRFHGLVVLASVVLCITGGEALYADLGHFGRKPIQFSWMTFVFPALLCNYFGQGAALLEAPGLAVNPFYGLVPRAFLYPMVALSTMASIIASQSMISGVFSLTQQAIQLGYCPRLRIVHTSAKTRGQIYVPEVNHALMVACIGLVLAFRGSSGLAGAYGIAVTAAMAITSIIYFFVVWKIWRWSLWRAVLLVGVFLAFDLTYFGANLLKVVDGGWFTLAVATILAIAMATWKDGRRMLQERIVSARLPAEAFMEDIARTGPVRVPGTAVFMTISPVGIPPVLLHHYKHNRVFHEQVVLLSIVAVGVPTVPSEERLQLEPMGYGFYRLIAHYGFVETPSVPVIMRGAEGLG
ncbi:MAG TPA: KUP/HAK/KT family potassium transporter, partial [Syntrophobacteria bacterium]|nr:KUP/HAK/KT family potassium transporter [Syntrophobacteria bacterium]